MDRDLVEVASYGCRQEARRAKSFLATHGILAVVAGGADAPPSDNDLDSIALSVSREFVERTAEIFASPEGDPYTGSWNCRQCGESIIVRFTVCWRCGTTRGGQRNPGFAPVDPEDNEEFNGSENMEPQLIESAPDVDQLLIREPAPGTPAWQCANCSRRVAEDEPHCWNCGATRGCQINPYSSPLLTAAPQSTPNRKPRPDDETAQHLTDEAQSALLQAIFGCIWPPSLVRAIFSLFELRGSLYQLPPSASWRYKFGWIIACVAIVEFSIIAFAIYTARDSHVR